MCELVLGVMLAMAAPAVVSAQTPAPAAETARLDRGVALLDAWLKGVADEAATFAPVMLQTLPAEQLAAVRTQLIEASGPYQSITVAERTTPGRGTAAAEFERATVTLRVSTDPKTGRVDGLFLANTAAKGGSLAAVTSDFASLPGRAGFTVARVGADGALTPLGGHAADTPLALGSAFKLTVLKRLADEVAAGRLRWDAVVPLGEPSIPSGITQDWPAGTPMTLQALATLMISISDNTATDTLVRLLDPVALNRMLGADGPMLTTVQATALKMPANADLLARWRDGDAAARARLLADHADRLTRSAVDVNAFSDTPLAIDSAEWFASPDRTARLLAELSRNGPVVRAVLGIVPGFEGDRNGRVAYAGFKGGSEPGVISMNWLVETTDGRRLVLAGSWMNPDAAVDTVRFQSLMLQALDAVLILDGNAR